MQALSDVDRGWAFAVAFAFFVVNILTMGVTWSQAIFFTTFLEEFEASPVLTAWAVNLNCFSTHVFGEAANFLINRLGPRTTIVIGCGLSCCGYLVTSFARTLTAVFFGFGVLTGAGFALCFLAPIQVVTAYFHRLRINALVFGSIGISVGLLSVAPLFDFFSSMYHWRGAFLLLCAAHLNLLVVAAVMMPPRGVPLSQNSASSTTPLRNFRILTNAPFCIYIISLLLISLGANGFYTHVTNFAILQGNSPKSASFLMSTVGGAGILCRIGWTGMTTLSSAHAVLVSAFFFSFLGLTIMAVGLCHSYIGLTVIAAFFGLFMSAVGLITEVIIFLVGIKMSLAGVSYCNVLGAFGIVIGGPLAAWLYEIDPTYQTSFFVSGAVCFLGGVLIFPLCVRGKNGKLELRQSYEDKFGEKELSAMVALNEERNTDKQ